MLASLILAAALLSPGAARLPVRCHATAIAHVIAVCSARTSAVQDAVSLRHETPAWTAALARCTSLPAPALSALAIQLRN